MTDRKPQGESSDPPEDVATLYSWANLHGAKYRDFSASRAQVREKARLRVQEVLAAERDRAREQAESEAAGEALRATEAERAAEAERQAAMAAQQANEIAARKAAQQAEQQAAEQAAQLAAQQATQAAAQFAAQQAAQIAAQRAAEEAARRAAAPIAPPQTYPVSMPPAPAPNFAPAPATYAAHQPAAPWTQPEPRADAARAAFVELNPNAQPYAPAAPVPAQDAAASRWFALKGVFDNVQSPAAAQSSPAAAHAPVLAVFSLAGGVGKTSLVATLGRALSTRGERVLLVDTAAYGLLPFFYGAHDQRPGLLRTFSPPGASADAAVQMVHLDPESLGPESSGLETLTQEVLRHARGTSRVLIDLATASGATTRRILRLAPTVLVPVKPDMNSVVSVGAIESFFQHNGAAGGRPVQPYYVLTQFDSSLRLHLDVREVLHAQLGGRLLPFVLRRTPAVSEALAEGMTVMDYAPDSAAAEDFSSLAAWINSIAAPASPAFRGVRWSER